MSYEHILLFYGYLKYLLNKKIIIDNYRKMYYSNSLTAAKKIVSVLTLILWQG